MFKVKISGIATIGEAIIAANAGADAIGFDFDEGSARFVSPKQTAKIGTALRESGWNGTLVASFANVSFNTIYNKCSYAPTTSIELNGDVAPDITIELKQQLRILSKITMRERWYVRVLLFIGMQRIEPEAYTLIRAFTLHSYVDDELRQVQDYLHKCAERNGLPDAIVIRMRAVNRNSPSSQADWLKISAHRDKLFGLPLVLGGDINPENVKEAIDVVRPDAVEADSEVLFADNYANPERVRRFIAAARSALEKRFL